jgi:hypothetical protein
VLLFILLLLLLIVVVVVLLLLLLSFHVDTQKSNRIIRLTVYEVLNDARFTTSSLLLANICIFANSQAYIHEIMLFCLYVIHIFVEMLY